MISLENKTKTKTSQPQKLQVKEIQNKQLNPQNSVEKELIIES